MSPASIVTDPTKLAELPFVIFGAAARFALEVMGLSFAFAEQVLRVTV